MTSVSVGSSDLAVFPLALGGNTFGWTSDESTSRAVLDSFVEQGGNFVDTADGYSAWVPGNSGGESESIIGGWMSGKGNRDQVVIATKVSQHPDFKGLAATNIARAAEASLKRLGTDHIDLYYAHYDDETVPLAETVEAFNALIVAGAVRYIGLSNYSAARVEEWIAIAEHEGFALPVALQPHYNLVHRDQFEGELEAATKQHGLGVFPYFSLASGFLTGKYRTPADFAGTAREKMVGPYFSDAGLAVVDALDEIAEAHATAISSVALAWLREQPEVVAPIASARTLEQLPDLMASATLQLSTAELDRLTNVSATVPA